MEYTKLKEKIDLIKGSTFAGLDTETKVKLTGGKKNLMQGRVTKRTIGANTMIFSNVDANSYENMVKRRMTAEGMDASEFSVGSRAWGTRVSNTPFIEHKEKVYLECIFISSGKSKYYLDDVEVDSDDIEGLPAPRPLPEQSQGGIDNKVIVRTFSLDSIKAIRIAGEELTQ